MTLSLVLLSFWLAGPSWAGPYDSLAAHLAGAAKRQAKTRLAVLPFQVLGHDSSTDGVIVSEKLVGRLAGGEVDVVERTLLESVMREQQLGVYGLADSRSVKELGKVLGVDALVAGTITRLKDERLEINARLIDAETAKVLAAGSIRVEKDWEEPLFEGFDRWTVPMPPIPLLGLVSNASAEEWRPGKQDCSHWEERVDEIDRAAVPLKVRKWARLLSDPGFSPSSLSHNPGSEIRAPQLRAQFYGALRAAHGARPRPLDILEESRLGELEQQAHAVTEACR